MPCNDSKANITKSSEIIGDQLFSISTLLIINKALNIHDSIQSNWAGSYRHRCLFTSEIIISKFLLWFKSWVKFQWEKQQERTGSCQTNTSHAVAPFFKEDRATVVRKRWVTAVRDEEKQRYDRKSLALSPLPASRDLNTPPQHSGPSPSAWMRSLPVALYSALPALILCIVYSGIWESISNMFVFHFTPAFSPRHRFIASQFTAASVSIRLFSLSL